MSLQTFFILAVMAVAGTEGAAESSPWVYSDNAPIPDGTLRITTLGSGSPDVRREQVTPLPLNPPTSGDSPLSTSTMHTTTTTSSSTAASLGLPGVSGCMAGD
jgi:hypothetical protein